MIAYEHFRYMKKKKRNGGKGYMALKLDMSKAYDRVEWIFLEKMLFRLGFHENWIKLIMSLVTSVSYSILVNGQPMKVFVPTRCLRQGDPLSPYLFLICTERLAVLIKNAVSNNWLMELGCAGQPLWLLISFLLTTVCCLRGPTSLRLKGS